MQKSVPLVPLRILHANFTRTRSAHRPPPPSPNYALAIVNLPIHILMHWTICKADYLYFLPKQLLLTFHWVPCVWFVLINNWDRAVVFARCFMRCRKISVILVLELISPLGSCWLTVGGWLVVARRCVCSSSVWMFSYLQMFSRPPIFFVAPVNCVCSWFSFLLILTNDCPWFQFVLLIVLYMLACFPGWNGFLLWVFCCKILLDRLLAFGFVLYADCF